MRRVGAVQAGGGRRFSDLGALPAGDLRIVPQSEVIRAIALVYSPCGKHGLWPPS